MLAQGFWFFFVDPPPSRTFIPIFVLSTKAAFLKTAHDAFRQCATTGTIRVQIRSQRMSRDHQEQQQQAKVHMPKSDMCVETNSQHWDVGMFWTYCLVTLIGDTPKGV